MDKEHLKERLESAFQRRQGQNASVSGLTPLSAGASAATWRFELDREGASVPLIAQFFTGEHQFAASIDKRTQGLVQQCAFEAGIPTPRIEIIFDGEDGIGDGFVTEFREGETLGHRIVRDDKFESARSRMTGQCARILAAIHGMDTRDLPALPDQEPGAMIDTLFATHTSYGQRIPTFDLAFQWLADRAAFEKGRKLIHGDFRNGNFIVSESGIDTVLDWEVAHLGDPHEDLGWLCMNAWRFGRIDKPVGGFGDRSQLYADYEAASGTAVDADRVRFWEVYSTLKWGVVCQWFASQYLSGEVRTLERAAIGRRVSETELDLLDLIEGVE
jgi:aminoglycoside phosphotransferase (APT) family kinase protein